MLVEEIRKIHVDSEATFGSPRVHDALRKAGRTVTLRRVADVMAKAGIVGLTGREHCTTTTRRDRMQAPFPDLVQRNFLPAAPDLVWQDIAPRMSIEAQPRVVELCLSRLNCTDPMRGGIEMYPGAPDAEDYCTMGFHVWAPGVNSAVLTAGHREYSTNPTWKNNGINIGGEIDTMYPQFAGASNEFLDAAAVHFAPGWAHSNKVYRNGPTELMSVTGLWGNWQLPAQSTVCKSVATNDWTCGWTLNQGVWYTSASCGCPMLGIGSMNMTSLPGDSGLRSYADPTTTILQVPATTFSRSDSSRLAAEVTR